MNKTTTRSQTKRRMFGAVIICLICIYPNVGMSQKITNFKLPELLKKNKLITYREKVTFIEDGTKPGISTTGIVWIRDFTFSTGTIEVDLRGKDVLQQSFLGIAFHGIDTLTFDAIYFRPFNFKSSDSLRRSHAVQYISHPDYTWKRLREEHPGQYEKPINPAPSANEWFHARIVVTDRAITVFVNNASTPSLTVTKLNDRKEGLLGLWNFALPGDFANLKISR